MCALEKTCSFTRKTNISSAPIREDRFAICNRASKITSCSLLFLDETLGWAQGLVLRLGRKLQLRATGAAISSALFHEDLFAICNRSQELQLNLFVDTVLRISSRDTGEVMVEKVDVG
jgi:hypothetical protein